MQALDADGCPSLEVLTLALDGETFALEARHVREILDLVPVTEVPGAALFLNGLINVRGKVVALADLCLKLGLSSSKDTLDTRIVVVEIELSGVSTTIGLRADKVYEIAEVPTTSVEETPRFGMRWPAHNVRCIAKREAEFLIVLDLEAMFAEYCVEDTANGASRAILTSASQ